MIRTALLLAGLLVALAALVRAFEPRFAFFPAPGETTTPRDFGLSYDRLTIRTRDGERLTAWVVGPREADTPSTVADGSSSGRRRADVLYFHGNGGNLSIWTPVLAGIARQGHTVFAVDYRGYGTSSGRPSERGLYRDVDAVLEQFWSRPHAAPVLYWGRSLGGSMAAYAATVRSPDAVIMESTFPDVRTLVRTSPVLAALAIFSSYRFPSAAFLERRLDPKTPVLVMHGDADQVIPFEQGRALFDRIPEPKQFVPIPGGDHNDLAPPDGPRYWRAIETFITGL
jgi:uncharacterized protein